jgi:hypothetical protein
MLKRQTIAAAQQGGGNFLKTCVELRRIVGANELDFICRWDDNTVSAVKVASYFDLTGQYAVGHDAAVGAVLADLERQTAMGAVLQSFLLLGTTRPEASAKLLVQGAYSKSPNGTGIAVATNLTLVLE